MIAEQEIEKLAEEYGWNCKNEFFTTPVKANECQLTSKRDFVKGFQAALSNPDYILIEKEYIEKLWEEFIKSDINNGSASSYHQYLKDILSNLKTKL